MELIFKKLRIRRPAPRRRTTDSAISATTRIRPSARAGAAAAGTSVGLERLVRIRTRRLKCGQDANEHAGHNRQREGPEQHAPVIPAWRSSISSCIGITAAGPLETDIGDDNTHGPSCEREEEALHQQMPDESPARGAERQTHRQLPRCASSIVRGRDSARFTHAIEQDQADGSKEQKCCRPDVLQQRGGPGHGSRRQPSYSLNDGVSVCSIASGDRSELRVGLGSETPGASLANDAELAHRVAPAARRFRRPMAATDRYRSAKAPAASRRQSSRSHHQCGSRDSRCSGRLRTGSARDDD